EQWLLPVPWSLRFWIFAPLPPFAEQLWPWPHGEHLRGPWRIGSWKAEVLRWPGDADRFLRQGSARGPRAPLATLLPDVLWFPHARSRTSTAPSALLAKRISGASHCLRALGTSVSVSPY